MAGWFALTAVGGQGQGNAANAPIPNAADTAAPAFDVAAIRVNNSDHTARSHIYSSPNDGEFRAINVPMNMLLQFAFGLPETRILGGPGWLNSIKFDVEAKADSAANDRMRALSSSEGKVIKQKMVRALLAERFKLISHVETRELPVYALVVAKGGPKLQDSKSNGLTIDSWNSKIELRGGNNTIDLLAEELAKKVGRVVVDKTGIQGRYDITLTWSPDDGVNSGFGGTAGSAPAANAGSSIFTALQEQLGLKLESQKGPVQVLVIDSIDMPSAN
ncbi:MAG: TIGR03435 family protein [Terracidiphilus sp.]|jgi:uncharacterized protein (TIGR03435 family)